MHHNLPIKGPYVETESMRRRKQFIVDNVYDSIGYIHSNVEITGMYNAKNNVVLDMSNVISAALLRIDQIESAQKGSHSLELRRAINILCSTIAREESLLKSIDLPFLKLGNILVAFAERFRLLSERITLLEPPPVLEAEDKAIPNPSFAAVPNATSPRVIKGVSPILPSQFKNMVASNAEVDQDIDDMVDSKEGIIGDDIVNETIEESISTPIFSHLTKQERIKQEIIENEKTWQAIIAASAAEEEAAKAEAAAALEAAETLATVANVSPSRTDTPKLLSPDEQEKKVLDEINEDHNYTSPSKDTPKIVRVSKSGTATVITRNLTPANSSGNKMKKVTIVRQRKLGSGCKAVTVTSTTIPLPIHSTPLNTAVPRASTAPRASISTKNPSQVVIGNTTFTPVPPEVAQAPSTSSLFNSAQNKRMMLSKKKQSKQKIPMVNLATQERLSKMAAKVHSTCPYCNLELQTAVTMFNHVREKHREYFADYAKIECTYPGCDYRCTTPGTLVNHEKYVHDNIYRIWVATQRFVLRNARCSFCDEEVESIPDFQNHVNMCHYSAFHSTTAGVYACGTCNDSFFYVSDLFNHWRQCISCTGPVFLVRRYQNILPKNLARLTVGPLPESETETANKRPTKRFRTAS